MISKPLGRAPTATDVPVSLYSDLSGHIKSCWEEAKVAKQPVTERLLRCERQRRGEYDPDKIAEIRDQGGTDIYMMLTDVKCRAAESWIKDVMLSADRTWSMSPTVEPSIPIDLREGVIETVVQEAIEAQAAGMQLNPGVIELRLDEVYEEVKKKINEAAREATDRMISRMDDILEESNWSKVISELITDFATYPYSILKGPIVRRRRQLKWSKTFKPIVEDVIGLEFERVNPYDAFWSPNSTSPQDGYFIERIKMTRAALSAMIGMPNVNNDQVQQALDAYGQGGLREYLYSDVEQTMLKGRSSIASSSTDLIEGLNFWGSVSGSMLNQWGMKDADPYAEYEINAWMFGPHVILCRMNPDPLGKRPYSKECWETIPGAFAGKALPELMRDVASMSNAAARALANNMSLASGPQAEISVDRLAKGEEITELVPWRIWQTTTDRTGGGQPAVRFFQPNMNAEPLLNVYTYFQKVADEVTGVPNYVYGSSSVSGAGRTASGLSMLMENAAKGIKTAILALDTGIGETLTRLYNHLMIYDKDPLIKADAQVVATGVVATLMKDQIQARRNEFLAATLNPIDTQIVTPDRRAYLLREQAKTLNLDVDKLVPDQEQIKQQMAEQQMAQQQMAQAQQMQQATEQPE
jgi:hypothetical protein